MKTVVILLLASFLITGCSRGFSPHQAASKSMKCGKGRLR